LNNTEEQVGKIIAQAEEAGISHFRACIVDTQGRLLGKRYHVSNLRKIMTDGTGFVEALNSGVDPGYNPIATNPHFDYSRGFADTIVVMDAESARKVPYVDESFGLMLLGEYSDEMADKCPRALLGKALGKLSEIGYQAYGAFELECSVLAETAATIQSKTPENVAFTPGFAGAYSFPHETMKEELFSDLLTASAEMDIEIDSIHSEFINMVEVGLKPQEGIRIADNATLYKSLAKIVGSKHDIQMSFMAMLNNTGQSCGAHLNLSLRKDGKAIFYDNDAEQKIGDEQRYFVGGMQRYLPDLFLMLAPNLNSYKRFAPGQFAPATNTWGVNNKTVAYRAINLAPSSARVEARVAGADVNPHLALLAVVTAGRLGLQDKLEPTDPVVGNGMESEQENPFPTRFTDAIEKFKSSAIARQEFGDAFVDVFASDRQWQVDQFQQAVTDWELKMFYDV
jgi:glutamine synthetase